ncbi:MAG: 16S rRNA (guanine(527)-N(7))-methyltransferase RsmG [Acidobacteriota bacterium]
MEDFRALLELEFSLYGALTAEQLAGLDEHYRLLLRWHPKINLTRITSLQDAVRYHYCESLYLAKRLPPGPVRIVDVGSGAGFPGIPVAIYRPECAVDLVESDQRKAVFLHEAARKLTNVRVLPQRAESVDGSYDWVVSRAVRPDAVLKLNIAPRFAILGVEGEPLPWGEKRSILLR